MGFPKAKFGKQTAVYHEPERNKDFLGEVGYLTQFRLDELLYDSFLLIIFGQTEPFPDSSNHLLSLPSRDGGLSIPSLLIETPQHYESSTTLAKPHVDLIIAQSMVMNNSDEDIRRAADIKRQATGNAQRKDYPDRL